MKEIPRTNYDCIKEEKLELDGISELELLERLSSEYSYLLSQAENVLEKEFSVAQVNLNDTNDAITLSNTLNEPPKLFV